VWPIVEEKALDECEDKSLDANQFCSCVLATAWIPGDVIAIANTPAASTVAAMATASTTTTTTKTTYNHGNSINNTNNNKNNTQPLPNKCGPLVAEGPTGLGTQRLEDFIRGASMVCLAQSMCDQVAQKKLYNVMLCEWSYECRHLDSGKSTAT
jgi:hypothetical protein